MAFIKDVGGWGALVVFFGAVLVMAWMGGKAFMALAREFSSSVVENLEGIREEVAKHNERLKDLDDRLARVDDQVGSLTNEVRRQSAEIAAYHRKP